MNKYRTIGRSEIRLDAKEKVTGKAKYVADIALKNMKYGVIFRSSLHHANIIKLDINHALKSEGVINILTAKNIPGTRTFGEVIKDRPVLASKRVRFLGDPIAIVIADSMENAIKGREKIILECEELDAVFDPIQAMASSALKIHTKGNLLSCIDIHEGSVDEAFRASDIILKENFELPTIYHAYLETEAAVAHYENGSLIVYVSSQKPFEDQAVIADVLGLPRGKVCVRVAAIGGSFGGKEDSSLPMFAALATWETKQPVKLANTRSESMLAHHKRHACKLFYKLGAKKNGKILALQVKAYLNTGPYAAYGKPVALHYTECVCGSYNIPNVKIETYLVYTNSLIGGAMRGFGVPQSNFAIERIIEILASKLKLDSWDIRKLNILRAGDRSFTRVLINQGESVGECLRIAANAMQKFSTKRGHSTDKTSGIGMALNMHTMGFGRGIKDDVNISVELLSDGYCYIHLGTTDLGQGLKTIVSQVASEALGIDFAKIIIKDIDTCSSPDGGICGASKMTYCTGNVIIKAVDKLKKKIIKVASEIYSLDSKKLVVKNGSICQKQALLDVKIILPLTDFAKIAHSRGIKLMADATFSFPYEYAPTHLPLGLPSVLFCFGAAVVCLEVDKSTGRVEVKEIVGIYDVGRIINRAAAEGQVEGGAVMGIGYALSEAVVMKQDGLWTNSLGEYFLPTSLDSPPTIKTIFLENPEPSGPYGAKGLGEITVGPIGPAIANAVYNATGIQINKLPIKNEDLQVISQILSLY